MSRTPRTCSRTTGRSSGQQHGPGRGKQAAIIAPAMFVGVLLLFGWTWGGIGLLLAVPLLVVVRVIADRIEGARPLARLLTDD